MSFNFENMPPPKNPQKREFGGFDFSNLPDPKPIAVAEPVSAPAAPVPQEEPGFFSKLGESAEKAGQFALALEKRSPLGQIPVAREFLQAAQLLSSKAGDRPLVPLRQGVDILFPESADPKGDTDAERIDRLFSGSARGAASLAEGFVTPRNIALIAATQGAGALGTFGIPAIDKVIKYGPAAVDAIFAGLAIKHAPEAWKEFLRIKNDPNSSDQQLGEAATQVAGAAAIAYLGAKGAISRTRGTYAAEKEAGRLRSEDAARQAETAAAEAARLSQIKSPRQFVVDEAGQAVSRPVADVEALKAQDKAQRDRLAAISPESLLKEVNAKAKSIDDLSPAEKAQYAKLERAARPERAKILDELRARRSQQMTGREELAQAGRTAEEIGREAYAIPEDVEIIPPREIPQLETGRAVLQIPAELTTEADLRGYVPPAELQPGVQPAGQLPPPRRAFYAPSGEAKALKGDAQDLHKDYLLHGTEVREAGGILKGGLRPGSSVGAQALEAGPVIFGFKKSAGAKEVPYRRGDYIVPEGLKDAEFVLFNPDYYAKVRTPEQIDAAMGKLVKELKEKGIPEEDIYNYDHAALSKKYDAETVSKIMRGERLVDEATEAERLIEEYGTTDVADYNKQKLLEVAGNKPVYELKTGENRNTGDTFYEIGEQLNKPAAKIGQVGPVIAEPPPPGRREFVGKRAEPKPSTPAVASEAPKPTEPVPSPIPEVPKAAPRPNQNAEANTKAFDSALDDFNTLLATELSRKPATEQMALAKARLEEKGYHPAIVEELTNPERFKRPDLEGDVHEATTRPGRLARAQEPPPELKAIVDQVAQHGTKYRNAEADYNAARDAIITEVEKLGGEVIVNTADGTLSIKFKEGKPKLSEKDAALIARLKQEAADAGAFSLASVGKGFEVAGAPLKIKDPTPVTGDFRAKLIQFIQRKKEFQAAKKAYDLARAKANKPLTDYYLSQKAQGKGSTSFVGKSDVPVEVLLRRKASKTMPDTQKINPATGKPYAEGIAQAQKEAYARSAEVGPRGEPYVQSSKISSATGAERKAAGKPFFDLTQHLTPEENAALDAAFERGNKRFGKLQGRIDAGLLDASMYRDLAETGYYVSKALARATKGKVVEFGQWTAEMIKHYGEKIKPLLKDLWLDIDARMRSNFKYYEYPQVAIGTAARHLKYDFDIDVISGELVGSFAKKTLADAPQRPKDIDVLLKVKDAKPLLNKIAVGQDVFGFPLDIFITDGKLNLVSYQKTRQIVKFVKIKKELMPKSDKASGFNVREYLSEAENAALDRAYQDLKTAQKEISLAGGVPVNPAAWKAFGEIGYHISRGLGRAAKEITLEQFDKALKNTVSAEVYGNMKAHLKEIWDALEKLPEGWKPGDAFPMSGKFAVTEDDKKKQAQIEQAAQENSKLFMTTDITTRLEKQNVVAKKIAQGIRQAVDLLENTRAKYNPGVKKLARALSGPVRTRKIALLNQIAVSENGKTGDFVFKAMLENPEKIPWDRLNKEQTQALKTYMAAKDGLDTEINTLLKNEKIKELAEQGDLFPELIDWVRKKKGFQVTLNSSAREALFVDQGGPFYDAILEGLLDVNPGMKKTDAVKYIANRQMYKFTKIPTLVKYGNRLVPIGAVDALSATEAMVYEGARLLAFMKVFGTKYKQNTVALRKAYIEQFAKEGKSAVGKGVHFDELFDAYWGLRKRGAITSFLESERPINSNNIIAKLLNPAIRGVANVALPVLKSAALTASAPLQAPQPFLAVPNVGMKNLAKAYKDAGHYTKTAAELEALGGIDREVLNWAIDFDTNLSGGLGRVSSGIINRADLMGTMSNLNDVVAAGAYRHWARGLIAEIAAGKKLSPSELQTLRNLKFSDAQIKMIEQGQLVEPKGAPETAGEQLFASIVRRGRKNEQFTGLSATERTRFQNATGLSKLLLPFQSYTIGSANRWRKETRNLIDAAKTGKASEYMPAIRRFGTLLGLTGAVLGEWSNLMRHVIRGHSKEDIEEDSAIAQAAKGEPWEATKNFVNNFADAGFLGPFMRIANNKTLVKELRQAPLNAIANLAWGPGLAADVISLFAQAGKYANLSRFDAAGKFFEGRVPGVRYAPDAAVRALSVTGLADASEQDVMSAAYAYRDWADENLKQRNYPPAFGYAEDKAQMKKAYAAFKGAINLSKKALEEGSDAEIKDILDKALVAKAEKVKEEGKLPFEGQIEAEAQSRVRKSLQGFRFNVKNLTEEQAEALIAKIGEKRYQTLITHDTLLNELINSL